MKNGIFYRSLITLFYLSLFSLTGCAAFIELDDRDPGGYDRGYTAAEDDDAPCSGRFCDSENIRSRARENISRNTQDEESGELMVVSDGDVRIRKAVEARDVVVGMNAEQVQASWGEPTLREAAGDGRGGHERWTYGSRYSLNGSRTIIFENGKVAGWSR